MQAARQAISDRLEHSRHTKAKATGALSERCGAFVTLHHAGTLRGCIGFLTGKENLLKTVIEAALASAFQDSRFGPLQKDELPQTQIEISVLSHLKRITSVEEIQVGTHGILIKQGPNSGLLLPQVAEEYGWDREKFLTNTCYKAGLAGNCWKDKKTEIDIFSAVVFGEDDTCPI